MPEKRALGCGHDVCMAAKSRETGMKVQDEDDARGTVVDHGKENW